MGHNPAREEAVMKDRLKILVVDDEPDVHAVLGRRCRGRSR
jgi:hypothetical protein